MKIKDIMTENVQVANKTDSVLDIAKMMKTHDCGSIPVAENDKLVGMITDRDIVLRCVCESCDPQDMTAGECMSSKILYCRGSDNPEDVLKNMGEQAIRRLPVVDENKRLIGIVSFGDLSAACNDKASAGRAMEDIREAA